MSTRFGVRGSRGGARRREALVVLCGVFFISLVSIAGVLLIQPRQSVVEAAVPSIEEVEALVNVLVPVRNVEQGEPLTKDLFREERRPLRYQRAGTIRSPEELRHRYAKSLLLEGEPLVIQRITPHRVRSPITPQISKDRSAVTIRVDDLNSSAGLVRPGELVDVAWIHSINGQQAISLIVRSAPVLAADQQVDGEFRVGTPVPGTITLMVSPPEALQIQLAARTGSLSLSLRPPEAEYAPGMEDPITYAHIARSSGPVRAESAEQCSGTLRIQGERYCISVTGELKKEG